MIIDHAPPPVSSTSAKKVLTFALLGLLIFFIIGMSAIYFFVQYEKNRDLIIWQDKLAYYTQIEKKTIDNALLNSITELQAISNNPTVKLYTSVLQAPSGDTIKDSEHYNDARNARRYLKELLIIQGAKLGFSSHTDRLNLNRHSDPDNEGIMIVDAQAEVVVAGYSRFMLPQDIVQGVQAGLYIKPHQMIELSNIDSEALRISFILPIYPPQTNRYDPEVKALAYLIAIKDIAPELKRDLAAHVATHQHEALHLLRKDQHQVLYLLSLYSDNVEQLQGKRQLEGHTDNLDAVYALNQPGRFQEKRMNYAGQDVLLSSQLLNELPWVLMHSIEQDYALLESNNHARFLYVTFSISFMVLICLLVLIWRHSASMRYQAQLSAMQIENNQLQTHNRMLQLITDNLNGYVMVLDDQQRLAFGNKAFSRSFGQRTVMGQNLSHITGNNTAKRLTNMMGNKQNSEQLITFEDEEKILQTSYIPLGESDSGDNLSMIVATDVSASIQNERLQEKIMQQAVLMLTKTLEQHDPYSAQHSSHVKKIAVQLGKELGLNESDLFKLSLSASLINVGKFYVPREILVKQEQLTDEEHKIVQGHIVHTIEMLKEIEMDKAVIEIVSQAFERIDGKGYPKRLKGDDINYFSRIIAVTNAFVAMTYPRSWRQGMEQVDALELMMNNCGYDKKIVIALYNMVENKRETEK